MTLRRKLLTAFGGLAATAVLAAAVALYVSLRWQATASSVEDHYRRSLLLQNVRAETFQALAEVNDALAGDLTEAADARRDFRRAIAPTRASFAEWAALADTGQEQAEVREVRAAHGRLLADAGRVFVLLDAGRRAEAVRLVDDQLDTGDYAAFRDLTERIVARDRQRRQEVRASTVALRRSAGVMATVAMLAALSLALLVAAYLAQDLFRPLARLRAALDALTGGDTAQRLDGDREDEIGAVCAAYNRAAEAVARREMLTSGSSEEGGDWRETPSRLTLHRLVAGLQARLAAMRAAGEAAEALAEAEGAAHAIARFAAIGFPLDLSLETCDPRLIAQEALSRFGPQIAARGVSCELLLDPTADRLLADRLKVREALEEAVRNALAALPERGGRLGLRLRCDRDAGLLHFEVADHGRGMEGDLIERAFAADPFAGDESPHVGLAMVRAVAERHGGQLELFSEPGRGTVARLSLPLRA